MHNATVNLTSHKLSLQHALVYLISPPLLWFLFKATLHPLVSWLGLLVCVLGIILGIYFLAQLNHQMNALSEMPEPDKNTISFKKPLILSFAILIMNTVSGSFFIQHTYFPSSQNQVSISITNQADENVQNIYVQYGNTERIIKNIAPGEKQELIFAKQKNTEIRVKTTSDGIERSAFFILNPNNSYSSIRIDPLKNIVPNF